MSYHINTGLIIEKVNFPCECPLCEIQSFIEEQFLHEYLNDAVMDERSRLEVAKKGFCGKHFDMMFTRQNKLSVALQIESRIDRIIKELPQIYNAKQVKKATDKLGKITSTCVICDLIEKSMEGCYPIFASLYKKDENFKNSIKNGNGFCLKHFSALLENSKYAGSLADDFISTLCDVEKKNLERLKGELKEYCDSFDYRNARKPLGEKATVLARTRTKLFTKKTI